MLVVVVVEEGIGAPGHLDGVGEAVGVAVVVERIGAERRLPGVGAAFNMANTADRTLMGLLAEAWREMGEPERAPGLEGSLPDEQEDEGEHLDPLVDTQAMDRQRGRDFHETRAMATRILETGHADELPSALLGELAEALAAQYEAAHRDAARYPVARTLSRKLRELVATLQAQPSARLVEASGVAVAHWVQDNVDELTAAGLRTVADAVAGLLDRLEHVVAEATAPEDEHGERHEDQHEHESHDPAQRSEAHYERQVKALREQRAGVGRPLDRGARTATDADRAVERARTTHEKLNAEVDRIINHPFESTWWRGELAGWLQVHQREVSQWILDRNQGRIHSH